MTKLDKKPSINEYEVDQFLSWSCRNLFLKEYFEKYISSDFGAGEQNFCYEFITPKNEKAICLFHNKRLSGILIDPWKFLLRRRVTLATFINQLDDLTSQYILFGVVEKIDKRIVWDYIPTINYFLLFAGLEVSLDPRSFSEDEVSASYEGPSPLRQKNYFCLKTGRKLEVSTPKYLKQVHLYIAADPG